MRPASAVIACRVFPEMTDAAAAVLRFRTTITSTIRQYLQRRGLGEPKSILDAGCSTGIGTRWLAREFPEAAITGIDASPYFLAVAELEQRWAPRGTAGGRARSRVQRGTAWRRTYGAPGTSMGAARAWQQRRRQAA